MNLPNKLTLLRVFMVPLYIGCFYLPYDWAIYAAAVIFILAYLTDVADGYIARSRNLITTFGKFMDPIADKLLTASAIIMLTSNGMMSPIASIIIIAREFLISGFRLVVAGQGVVIAANWLGKIKTVSQAVALVMVMLQGVLRPLAGFSIDVWAVWISVFFTVASAYEYMAKNKDYIQYK